MWWKTIIAKLGIPGLTYVAVFGGGMFTMSKLTRDCADVVCPSPPACVCPTPEIQSIDFEKVKNMRGKIVLNQHYRVQMDGDSLVLLRFEEILSEKLQELKISRCK